MDNKVFEFEFLLSQIDYVLYVVSFMFCVLVFRIISVSVVKEKREKP